MHVPKQNYLQHINVFANIQNRTINHGKLKLLHKRRHHVERIMLQDKPIPLTTNLHQIQT